MFFICAISTKYVPQQKINIFTTLIMLNCFTNFRFFNRLTDSIQ